MKCKINSINNSICSSFFLIVIAFFTISHAQNGIPDPPRPAKLYNNLSKVFPNFLSPVEANNLEIKLEEFAQQTSNQIVVIITDDLAGYEPAEYAALLGDKWKIGQEKEDNGIVVLIKPTGEKGERKTFIAPGRGLEAVIPDYTCSEIVTNEMIPNFQRGDYAAGISQAVDVLMRLSKGEFNSDQYSKQHDHLWSKIVLMLIIFGVIIFVFFVSKKGGGKGGSGRGGSSWGYYGAGFMGGSLGGFGGGSSGSFGGGGGFGGFGGGSFGGGGAGGSW